jgi:hypothetical protein
MKTITHRFAFALWKAVINGRGDEVLDLARSNLWR